MLEKNNKTIVIIFTYRYPFNPPTEQFLDMEMKFWLKENVDIALIPISRDYDSDDKYETLKNANVKVFPIVRVSKNKEIIEALLGIGHYIKSLLNDVKKIQINVEHTYYKSAWKYTLQQYFQGAALSKNIINTIPIGLLQEYNKIILYSYWLNPVATAICFYKQYLLEHGITNVKAIARAHGDGDLYVTGMNKYRPSYMILNRNLDKIFSISNSGCLYLKKQGLNNVHLSRLGVKRANSNFKVSYSQDFIIVSCSVINENKRVIRIAKALSKITHLNISWIHFGDGPLMNELDEWCKKNMGNNVKWKLNGYTDHHTIMNYYKENKPDLFINVSKMEGVPVSIMEAMSYGIPAIATNVGATSEIVINNSNGFLLEAEFDDDQLRALVERYLILEKIEKQKFIDSARETWMQEYNAEMNFMQFINGIVD